MLPVVFLVRDILGRKAAIGRHLLALTVLAMHKVLISARMEQALTVWNDAMDSTFVQSGRDNPFVKAK